MSLPTRGAMFSNVVNDLDDARRALSSARDWLNSDWQPLGSELSDAGATARTEGRRQIAALKDQIDALKTIVYDAIVAENARRR